MRGRTLTALTFAEGSLALLLSAVVATFVDGVGVGFRLLAVLQGAGSVTFAALAVRESRREVSESLSELVRGYRVGSVFAFLVGLVAVAAGLLGVVFVTVGRMPAVPGL